MAYYYIGVETDGNGLHSWTPPNYLQTYTGNQFESLSDGYYSYTWVDPESSIEYAVYEIDTEIDFPNGYNLDLFAHTNSTIVSGGPTSINPGETFWEFTGADYWTPTFGQDQDNPNTPIYCFNNPETRPANSWQTISGGKDIYVNTHNAYYKFSISVTANTPYTFSLYTYSENNYDGIMISTNGSLTYSNIYLNSSASSTSGYINHCTGLGTTKTATYTPTSSGTIYVYFKTDSSTISNYNRTGYSYGRITWVTGTTTTITLNANGGSGGTGSVTGGYGSALPSITVPTRSGLVFMGYYDTSAISGGTQYYNSNGVSVRNWDKTGSTYTLYARWLNKVTWSYNTTYHYCTPYAQVATTTTSKRTSTLRMYPGCGIGTLSATLTSIYNDDTGTSLPSSSIGTGTNQWTLSSDGRELSVPAGVSAANYEIHVLYRSLNGTDYTGEVVTASAFFNVTATYVTNYGNVYDYMTGEAVEPASGEIYSGNIEPADPGEGIVANLYLIQINNFPASAFTMSTSTVSQYFENTADFRQWVTYNNGASRQGTIAYDWSGSSTSFSSLGTTEHAENFDVTFNTLTLTAIGEGGKSAVVDYANGGTRSANVCTWNAAPEVSYSISSYTFPAAGGTYDVVKSNVNAPAQTGTWTSGSSASFTPGNSNIAFARTATADGITAEANVISNGGVRTSATNNTSTSTRGTMVIRARVSYKNATKDAYINFDQAAGAMVYENPVISHTTPVSLSNTGQEYTMSPTFSQTYTWNGVSGSGGTVTSGATYSYAVQTSKTGYSLSSGKVTVTNNTSTSARNGFVVRITCSSNSKSSTKDITFNQPAGAMVYAVPTISTYSYATYAAAGATKTPTVSYSQAWTWNGVSGSGGTITSGGTLAFTKGTLTSGATAGSSFASDGTITWGNNTTTSARSTHSVLNVTVTLNSKTSSTKTCTACTQSSGSKVYAVPTISTYSYATYAAAGATKTPTVSYSQAWTWNGVSGSGGTITSGGTLAFTKGTLTSGATAGSSFASDGTIIWSNNTTTSARSTHSVLNVKVTLNSKTSSTKTCTACTQSAGAKVYGTPEIEGWSYGYYASAGGEVQTPNAFSYTQAWTWNGVAGSGGVYNYDTDGAFATHSYTSTGTLPTGCTKGSNFSTMGLITWADRGTTPGDILDASSNLKLTITANGKTSSAVTCSFCKQEANELGTTKYKNTSGTTGYNIVYNAPTVSFNSNTLSAAGGYANVNCSVTNSTNWYYKYTSGSYSSLQTGEEAGTARWRITSVEPTGTTRFHEPSSGGSNLNIGGANYATYVSGTSVTHDSMSNIETTDRVTVTAYNTGNTSKSASISSANIVNELGTTTYKNTSGTTGYYSQTYGKPSNVTIGSGITAGQSSASLSCTCNDTFEYYLRYTSGTYTSLQTDTHASTIIWSVYSRTFIPDGGSSTTTTRFLTSGSTLSHSSMTSNVGTDRVIVRATNSNSTSKYTNSSALTVTNELGTTKYKNTSGTTGYNSQTYGTPTSVTVGSGLLASGGSATASCTCDDTFKYYLRYTSGTYTSLQTDTHASTITWSINSQTFTPDGGSATTTTRFSISGSTVSHSSMGTNVGTDTVTVKATNANSTSKTGTGSKSVTNAVDSISLTVGSNPISFGSSTNATVIATYTSTATQDVSASATYSSENSTGIVSIDTGTTVTGLYVDEYYMNNSYIINRGGVGEFLADYNQQEHCYEPYGTITYGGATRYLWKFSSAKSSDSTEEAYIVTTTNDPLTLLNSSSEYNKNNIFEQDLIVASLYSDKTTYSAPPDLAITKVVLG